MSIAELKEMRKEAKKYLDHADERVVKKVYKILAADTESEELNKSGLTPDQEAILQERMGKYKKGLMKFSTWEEVEKRIVSRAKNAI